MVANASFDGSDITVVFVVSVVDGDGDYCIVYVCIDVDVDWVPFTLIVLAGDEPPYTPFYWSSLILLTLS